MKRLSSAQHPAIQLAIRLGRKRRPGEETLLLVEGEKLVREGLRSGARPECLFVLDGRESGWVAHDETLFVLPEKLLERITGLESPPPVIAILHPPVLPSTETLLAKARTLVVLDRVQDPGNLGTILRSGEALGADGLLLLQGCCSPANPKVIRAAMGSAFRLPVLGGLDGAALLAEARRAGFTSIAADMGGTAAHDRPWPARSLLLFGAEGQGLEPGLRAACDECRAIPLRPPVESLNVATAVSLFLYERHRGTLEPHASGVRP